jgi:ATP-dependent RNA helicase DeaD
LTTFEELGIKQNISEALAKAGIVEPTEVQAKVIPIALLGRDVITRAKTGTGKTYAFALPIMSMMKANNGVEVLVLAPTRELALQTYEAVIKLNQRHINPVVVYGGVSLMEQARKIQRGANMVIGTPGRVLDLLNRGVLTLDRIAFFVLDEADTMLDMGFIEDVEAIAKYSPKTKQTFFLSATIPESLFRIAREYMRDPEFIPVGEDDELTVKSISHTYTVVHKTQKFQALLAYMDTVKPKKAIIFLHTKFGADMIHGALAKAGYNPILMHGGLSQNKREHALHTFKSKADILVTTNVTARGIDIKDITDVINYDVPTTPYIYIHRVGRSARMGKDGRAFTIVTDPERRMVEDVEYEANITMKHLDLNLNNYAEKAREAFYGARMEGGDRGGRGRFGGDRGRFGGGRGGGNRFGGRGRFGDRDSRGGRYGGDRRSSGDRDGGRGGGQRRRYFPS